MSKFEKLLRVRIANYSKRARTYENKQALALMNKMLAQLSAVPTEPIPPGSQPPTPSSAATLC